MIPGWRFLLPCYKALSLKSVTTPIDRERETPLGPKGNSQLPSTNAVDSRYVYVGYDSLEKTGAIGARADARHEQEGELTSGANGAW